MRIITLLLLLLGLGGVASPLRAQCLALDELLRIGAAPTALVTPQVVTQQLAADWVYTAPGASSREAFWTFPAPDGTAASRLNVRAQRPGQDVVFKTTQASCVRQLRSELKSQKLEAQPVTCAGCEAVRYKSPDFEATIYSEMKGDFPFVVVIHQAGTVIQDPAAKRGAQVAAPLPAVEIALATQLLADPRSKILDVRTPEEFAQGHLQGAQNVDFRASDFKQQLSLLDPAGRYVLYCATGNRSGRAAVVMKEQGFESVINAGAYDALQAAGAK
ncbi:rhodanese-like domain-containing protein [Hymenobacter sp. IS2118]|uniref:rhodanese-like domain-containing protein n=1 Tax=Hymenobacter sp. IS2118 TaxID=1505605 RepID=UPI00190FB4ED|nr:rhodanese-like domain-containing protein [Hymenobacter sp. IS2118]